MSEAISEPPVEPEPRSPSRRRPTTRATPRRRPASPAGAAHAADGTASVRPATTAAATDDRRRRRRRPTQPDLPERTSENRPSVEAAERALVRKPQIGDSRPAPPHAVATRQPRPTADDAPAPRAEAPPARRAGPGRGGARTADGRVAATRSRVELDEETLERRRGRERKGRPVGRYLMCVHVRPHATQIAVLEGRSLIEHYVSRPQDDVSQIHGNIYLGKVQNVLPGMEAAFVDIGTPKNAVLYRGDVQYDPEDVRREGRGEGRAHRAPPARRPDDPLPGHQEPDRHQGRPPHPGGVAAGPLRGPHPQQHHLRHLQAPPRRGAQAPAPDPRRGQARQPRPDRAHRGRGRHGRGAAARRAAAAAPVGVDRVGGQAVEVARRSSTASPTSRCA